MTPNQNLAEHIEACGRICYQSEPKGDPQAFVNKIITLGHTSVLEHAYRVIRVPRPVFQRIAHFWDPAYNAVGDWPRYVHALNRMYPDPAEDHVLLSINVRAANNMAATVQAEKADPVTYSKALQAIASCFPEVAWVDTTLAEELGIKEVPFGHYPIILARPSILTTCSRDISHEYVRHTTVSFSQESTRYVDLKAGVSFIQSQGFPLPLGEYSSKDIYNQALYQKSRIWLSACIDSAEAYSRLRDMGVKPGFARDVLNHSLKTQLVATASMPMWEHFLELRKASGAHEDIQVVARCVEEELEKFRKLFRAAGQEQLTATGESNE